RQLTGRTFIKMLPEFLSRRFWITSTPLYRRSLCDRLGPWSDLRFWEDLEYDLRAAALGTRVWHCPVFLTDLRDHASERLSAGAMDNPDLLPHMPRA